MARFASELVQGLARNAEAVCRHYLSNGHRAGNYWLVGDIDNAPGRSLYVRLRGTFYGPGAAGKWSDAATDEHGDLLDIIAHACGLSEFHEVADEARRFLNMPRQSSPSGHVHERSVGRRSSEAARRLFAMTVPIADTLAERYLGHRGVVDIRGADALRFHPNCYYRDVVNGVTAEFPALIAAVIDLNGNLTGVHRTWLDPDGNGKAQVESPRRAMGMLLGSGVHLGVPTDRAVTVMAAGEGLETVLSLRMALPIMPMIAGLSAGHLGALALPRGLRRLYIAGDADAAGRDGTGRLSQRAQAEGIEVLCLRPRLGDFNDDLRRLGLNALRADVADQLVPNDRAASMPPR